MTGPDVITFHQDDATDKHAAYIGDRVECTRPQHPWRNTDFACPRPDILILRSVRTNLDNQSPPHQERQAYSSARDKSIHDYPSYEGMSRTQECAQLVLRFRSSHHIAVRRRLVLGDHMH